MTILENLIELTEAGVDICLVDSGSDDSGPDNGTIEKLKITVTREKLKESEKRYLKDNKEPIIQLLKCVGASSARQLALLSPAQRRLWLIDHIEMESAQYNMPMIVQLEGELNLDAINKSFQSILDRHQVLRTVIRSSSDGTPVQVIEESRQIEIPVIDLCDLAHRRQLDLCRAESLCINEEVNKPFDLSSDLMLRVLLLRQTSARRIPPYQQSLHQQPSSRHILIVTLHHIASDGWSQGILFNEFMALYRAFSEARPDPLPALELQYADYAHWHNRWSQSESFRNSLRFWKERLRDLPGVQSLPLDSPRSPRRGYDGMIHKQSIEHALAQRLFSLKKHYDVTLFMLLQTAFAILIGRYSGCDDVVVGTPVANRNRSELAALVGYFANTLVLRTDVSAETDFVTLLQRNRDALLSAYEHQQLPFDVLVNELQPVRTSSHTPLFQIMVMLQHRETAQLSLPGLSVKPLQRDRTAAKFDLTLRIIEEENSFSLNWEYATALFRPATIKRFADSFAVLLAAICDEPRVPIGRYSLLPEPEKNRILNVWNQGNKRAYDTDTTLCKLFEQQANQRPDKIAVKIDGRCELTYRQLNEEANRLAQRLIGEMAKDRLVGLYFSRSAEFFIAIFAVLKAGGAYVPLDPDNPPERSRAIVRDANIEIVLTENKLSRQCFLFANTENAQVFDVDRGLGEDSGPAVNLSAAGTAPAPRDLAYVIYTSGSTGTPKGVMVEHASLTNFAFNMQTLLHKLGGADNTCWGLNASFCFDASLQAIVSLCFGATLVVIPAVLRADAARLLSFCRDNGINFLDCTPAIASDIESVAVADDRALPNLIVGGEAIGKPLWDRLARLAQKREITIINAYGPTEATVNSVWTEINGQRPRIGRALNNVTLYVLSDELTPLPVGVAGELYIGGHCLARGYFNQPELTSKNFIENPFVTGKKQRLYKTGDRVRWIEALDGEGTVAELEYLERIDTQVKVRGYRVELGEIEATLLSCKEIERAVVHYHTTSSNLVAYLVPRPEALTVAETKIDFFRRITFQLKKKLPDYMLPNCYEILETIPLTRNGKVDRSALPEPDIMALVAKHYVAPVTEIEIKLSQVWKKLLGLERVGRADCFFESGGNSLLAVKMTAEIRAEWGLDIQVKELFEFPSLGDLGGYLQVLLDLKAEQERSAAELDNTHQDDFEEGFI